MALCGLAQPSLDPISCPAQRDRSSHQLQRNTLPGKTHQHPSLCGNKKQLVPQGLKLFAFLSGGPQKKSRPPSSWENMLQKENY